MAFQWCARDGNKRHNKGIDADCRQPFAYRQDLLLRIAKPGKDIGRDLTPAKNLDCGGKTVEVFLK